MKWMLEHTRVIKVGCWLIVALLTLVAIIGVVDRYQRQRLLLLEGQQALLAQRSAWGFTTLVRQLTTHKLQQSLLLANPLPAGCLPDQYIAEQQRATVVQTEDVEGLSQFTLRVPIQQVAPLLSPEAPRMRLLRGVIELTSRQRLGYSCNGHFAVIRETRTQIRPPPLPPRTAIGPAFIDALIVHVAATQGQTPPLYVDVRFTDDKADLFPGTAAGWRSTSASNKQDEERFVRDFVDPQLALRVQFYSEPLIPTFNALFLSWNGLGLLLLVGILACLSLINWLVAQLIDAYLLQYRAATRDFLTGLYNRREAMTLAGAELARTSRRHGSLCMLMLDIDHFKKVNDTYGHDGGDEVLKFFAQLLIRTIRQQDLAARFGGEEFLILLPDTEISGARLMAERVIQTLHTLSLDYATSRIKVTCSLGVTAWRGADDTFQDMLIRADSLLYQAKQQGRDRYISD